MNSNGDIRELTATQQRMVDEIPLSHNEFQRLRLAPKEDRQAFYNENRDRISGSDVKGILATSTKRKI